MGTGTRQGRVRVIASLAICLAGVAGMGGEIPGGPPDANLWTEDPGHSCVSLPPCPGRLGGDTYDPCSYCELQQAQRECTGPNSPDPNEVCVGVLYRRAASPPACGFLVVGGTVDAYGMCRGGHASNHLCYRSWCSNVTVIP